MSIGGVPPGLTRGGRAGTMPYEFMKHSTQLEIGMAATFLAVGHEPNSPGGESSGRQKPAELADQDIWIVRRDRVAGLGDLDQLHTRLKLPHALQDRWR